MCSDNGVDFTRLRRDLYLLPLKYGLDHGNIAKMRLDLRVLLLNRLTGPHAHFLFGNDSIESRVTMDPTEWLNMPKVTEYTHHGRPCGRKLERGEPTHRCLTCGLDDTCVLCKYCFNPDDHIGHNVFVKISTRDDGGICDCGDTEAWKRKIQCLCDKGPQKHTPLPESFQKRVSQVLDVIFDYAVDVLSGCSLALHTAKTQEEIEKLDDQSKLDLSAYNIFLHSERDEMPIDKWCLQIWDDDRRSVMDMRSLLQLATKRDSHFINMITEHVQKTGKATVAIKKSLTPLMLMREKIKNFSTSIRSVEDIMREEMVFEIFDLTFDLCKCRLNGLHSTGLVLLIGEALLRDWRPGVSPKGSRFQNSHREFLAPSQDHSYSTTFSANELSQVNPGSLVNQSNPQQQSALKLAAFSQKLTDIDGYDPPTEAYLTSLSDSASQQLDYSEDDDDDGDDDIFGPQSFYGIRASALGADLVQSIPIKFSNWPIEHSRARAKLLIFFDVRLPKILRQKLADIYVATLLSSTDLKNRTALIYADIYPLLVQHHIYFDKDPELSITAALSTQLFTTPSIATTLMESDAFGVYLNMIRHLFMRNNKLNHRLFRNRRLTQVFHEFGYLLWRNSKKEIVGSNPYRIIQTANFLSLFQGLSAMKRQEDKHVEYENEKWVYCYASMPNTLVLARTVAVGIDCAVRTGQLSAITGIQTVAAALTKWQSELVAGLEPTVKQYDHGRFQNLSARFTAINPSYAHVSLLNPVHAFLAWLIEYSLINGAEQLRFALCLENPHSCALFQPPLCTLAVLSHISVGYWVRNGYALRIQLQSYRDATLRDLAFATDVYLAQVAFCILDPNTVFMNLAWNFSVLDFPNIPLGDRQQSFYLLDEFIHCLINILCDRIRFQGLRNADMKQATLTREILQVLGFKTMPYSELTRLIPENSVVDDQFDLALSQCSNYTEPKGPNGVGLYSLKPEFHNNFDPFYTHFTMAQCEEAEKEANAKMGPEYLVSLLPLSGTWVNLGRFTRCAAFGHFIFHVLLNIKSAEDNQAGDSFNKIMYLFLMAAKSDYEYQECNNKESELFGCYSRFVDMLLAPSKPGIVDYSIIDILQDIHEQARFQGSHSKIELLFKILRGNHPDIVLPSLFKSESTLRSNEISTERQKQKSKGKEIQKQILEDFQKQQQQFLQNNETDFGSGDDFEPLMDDESTEGYTFPKHCVLCQMPDSQDSIFGILTYTTKIHTIRSLPKNDVHWVKEAYAEDPSLDVVHPLSEPIQETSAQYQGDSNTSSNRTAWGPAYPSNCIRDSTVVQGCGHGVHYHCFDEFLKAQQQRRALLRFSSDHLSEEEFLCPLCRDLNNGFMPVLWNTNDLDTTTFLKDPENLRDDMDAVIKGTAVTRSIDTIVENTMSTLHPRFLDAIRRHDFSETFHVNVRNVLLGQMLRIKKMAVDLSGLDQAYGLRIVYRSFADTVTQIEVSLRGQTHSSPFGGLIVDQLPTRITQFLRVFAKYVHTLTGFILSGFTRIGREPEKYQHLCLAPKDTFTLTIEMFYMGYIVNGVSPKTVLRQVLVTEIGRVLLNAGKLDSSWFPSNCAEVEPNIAAILAQFSEQNPRIVYHMLQSHLTIILRRYALVVFAICGKYDPDDFVGIMNLSESDRLCLYLGLPNLNQLILNISDRNTAEGVAFTRFFQSTMSQCNEDFHQIEYPGVYRLIRLPIRLDMMFNIEGHKLSADPALCLICGEMCSIQCNYFTHDVGPCNQHVSRCGLTQGIFLLARRNVILLVLPKDRGTFTAAPYLDMHGEPDENMRRGRPHYLQPTRYDSLTREIWLWNGLSSLTARKLDQNQDTGGWETL